MIRFVLLFAFISISTAYAEDTLLVCPTDISASWNIASVPDGWDTLRSENIARHRLRAATFTDGHPKNQAFLKPYNADVSARTQKTRLEDVYHFSGEYPNGLYLVCSYRNTPAILFRRLPDTPKTCEVPYFEQDPRPKTLTIRCR